MSIRKYISNIKNPALKGAFIGFLAGVISLIIIISTVEISRAYYKSDSYYTDRTEYIYDNIDSFVKEKSYDDNNVLYTLYLNDGYYDEIHIVNLDSNPHVILWADREDRSFMHDLKWYIISDTSFDLDKFSLSNEIVNNLKKL